MRTLTVEDVTVREDLAAKLVDIRRHLHRYPELSFQEHQTAAYIATCLEEWDIPYTRMGETGIVVDLVGELGEGPHVGIRADIDALPVEEMTGLPYASVRPGVMHACGHDGHTAILLGTAYQLHRLKTQWAGRVRCIFQPGEEAEGAALRMIEQGVLENPRVDCVFALHLWPHLPHGTIGVRYGAVTAACDEFVIAIEGKGGHSARPHQGVDAIAISAQVMQGLSLLVARESNPLDPVVVHVGKIKGGSARNVIADRVKLEGTVRTVSAQTREKVRKRLMSMAESIAQSFGGTARVEYIAGHPAVINDEQITRLLEKRAAELLGPEAVHLLKEPSMGADDFGAFAEAVPSTYFRLGIARPGQPVYDLHHPQFQFDDSILAVGVNVLVWTVLGKLKQGVETGC